MRTLTFDRILIGSRFGPLPKDENTSRANDWRPTNSFGGLSVAAEVYAGSCIAYLFPSDETRWPPRQPSNHIAHRPAQQVP
jgi:hypothetical protein